MPDLLPFLTGLASLFDVAGALRPDYPIARSAEDAARLDAAAIASDWRTVGNDLRTAMGKLTDSDRPAAEERMP